MTYMAKSVDEYIEQLPEERKEAFIKLRKTILENLPPGFEECISYKMPSYVVPHSIYHEGYHCNPQEPLPFISLASQKNFIAFYHMGIYSQPELQQWFVKEYEKLNLGKLDMGKSCIRFKKPEMIPHSLLGELCSKISVEQWINSYESSRNKTKT